MILIIAVTSRLTAWLITPSDTITLGTSGLVFGYLAYLLVRGFFTRNIWKITLSVVVLFFYGSILLGAPPGASGISWQEHFSEAIDDFITAKFLRGSDPATQRI